MADSGLQYPKYQVYNLYTGKKFHRITSPTELWETKRISIISFQSDQKLCLWNNMVNNGSKQVCCVGYVIVPEQRYQGVGGSEGYYKPLCLDIYSFR